jgi:hypothetical protein
MPEQARLSRETGISPMIETPAPTGQESSKKAISDAAIAFIRDNVETFRQAKPFNYLVVDNFFNEDIAPSAGTSTRTASRTRRRSTTGTSSRR